MNEIRRSRLGVQLPWGVIDDQSVAEARNLIGVELANSRTGWNTEASADNIRQYVWGVGDENPLYLDDDYGRASIWGTRLAPGSFLHSIRSTVVAPKLPGVQWIFAGVGWTFFRPLVLGDRFTTRARLVDVQEKSGRMADRWILQTGQIDYLDADGALVATADSSIARTPRGEALVAAGSKRSGAAPVTEYSPQELDFIAESMLAETARAGTPLWFEDVTVGQELPIMLRGPLTQTDLIAWYCGTMGQEIYGGPLKRGLRYRAAHPDYLTDEVTGQKLSAGRGHVEPAAGVAVGMGGGYDLGPMRLNWIEQSVTNWMGDAGFIHQLDITLRRPNNLGQTSRIDVNVVSKSVVGDYGIVELAARVENWQHELTARGRAAVVLPLRASGQQRAPTPVSAATAARVRQAGTQPAHDAGQP
jgi:acyl dehydratase